MVRPMLCGSDCVGESLVLVGHHQRLQPRLQIPSNHWRGQWLRIQIATASRGHKCCKGGCFRMSLWCSAPQPLRNSPLRRTCAIRDKCSGGNPRQNPDPRNFPFCKVRRFCPSSRKKRLRSADCRRNQRFSQESTENHSNPLKIAEGPWSPWVCP